MATEKDGKVVRSRWAYYKEYQQKIDAIEEEDKTKKPDPLPAEMGEIEITPELARNWLLRNTKNRKININLLAKLVDEVKGDRWELNGQTISFKENGELNDGQHRLWAVVLGERPIKSLVVFDVENRAFATVDTGRARSGADVLTIAGFKYAAALAAAARWALSYEQDSLTYRSKAAGQSGIANEVLLRYVRRNPELKDRAVQYLTGSKKNGDLANFLPPSIVVYAQWVTFERAPRKAAEFWSRLANGAGLQEGNSILTLRNVLIEERAETRRQLRAVQLLSFVIKAWNAWEHGKQLRLLKYMENERYPKWGDNPDTSYVLPSLERAMARERAPKRLDNRLVWKKRDYGNGHSAWIVDLSASLEKNGLTFKEIRDRKNKFANGTVGRILRKADAMQAAFGTA